MSQSQAGPEAAKASSGEAATRTSTAMRGPRARSAEGARGADGAPGAERLLRWGLPLLVTLFHALTARGYGIFRDELYYLACADHLDFGYVDHPPGVALLAAAVRALAGDSLPALRFPSAVAAGVLVILADALTRALGGGRFARLTAQLATALAPIYLSLFSILSMNALDMVVWGALWWLAARILAGGDQRLWLAVGAVAGLGLQNKIGVLFLGLGLVAGLLVSRRWELLRNRYLWLGGGLAALLFLPHLLWQVAHDWPTLEFMENARRFKIAAISPLAFLGEQFVQAGPGAVPLWLAGFAFLLLGRAAHRFRALGWAAVTVLVLLVAQGAKPYYYAGAHLLLLAAGAVAAEGWMAAPAWRRALRPLVVFLVLSSLVAAPLAKPLLAVETYVRYADRLGFAPGTAERHELGRLPQFFADMHGWRELAETVSSVYRTLPEAERAGVCVYGQNYGEAGAIDYFRDELDLPPAVSGHNSYWLWGADQCSGGTVIIIGEERSDHEKVFTEVEQAATFLCQDCMPYENGRAIWVARGLRFPLAEIWPETKHYN